MDAHGADPAGSAPSPWRHWRSSRSAMLKTWQAPVSTASTLRTAQTVDRPGHGADVVERADHAIEMGKVPQNDRRPTNWPKWKEFPKRSIKQCRDRARAKTGCG